MGRSRGPETGRERGGGAGALPRRTVGGSELEGCAEPLARTRQCGDQLRTTKDGEVERQGGPRRQRQREVSK